MITPSIPAPGEEIPATSTGSSGEVALREALRPFADAAANIPAVMHDAEWIDPDEGPSFQAGHLRRARAALAASSTSGLTDGGESRESFRIGLSPPEPVSHPNEDWCDRYAAWYEGRSA